VQQEVQGPAESGEDLKKVREAILANVRSRMEGTGSLSDDEVLDLIDEAVLDAGRNLYFSLTAKLTLRKSVFAELRGLGILQSLLEDPEITEIMVNGTDPIFVEKGGQIQQLELRFESKAKLEDTIQQIVGRMNRSVNEANPIVDVRLQDGSRVSIVLAPVAIEGPIVTIRKFPAEGMTMEKLLRLGSITEEAAEFLGMAVRARYNIFISGGTGSGKTTFLNALSGYIEKDERIITIEDSAELQLRGIPNLVRLESRNANAEGNGAITIRSLIKTALRMRPNRIIVGEVRAEEAVDLLTALNTGHDGSLSTGHANSPVDALSRLETLVLMGSDIPLLAVRKQIASALELIVHLGRLRDRTRRVLEIVEVLHCEDGEIETNPLFVFQEEGEEGGRIIGRLKRTEHPLIQQAKLLRAGIHYEL